MADLDQILSGQGAIASEAPEVVKETPAVTEQAQAGQVTDDNLHEGEESEHGQRMVPQQALHAEKQKVKRYTEQVADFEKKLTEREAAWERRFEQLIGVVKPKEPELQAPEFWDKPEDFVKAQLSPVTQQIQQQREEFSQLMAVEKHGADTVSAAYAALEAELRSNPAAGAQYQSIMKSAHPYGALVEWHKRAQAQAEIGSDPEAYKAKLREELKAEFLAETQGGTQQAQTPAPVMPSDLASVRNVGNRSGPAWSGPQSLNDIFKR